MPYGYVDAHCNIGILAVCDITDELYGQLENVHVDAVDKTGLLCYRNELGRAYIIAAVILHACQRFKAPQLVVHVVLRLEVAEDLVRGQS